jgi:DNA-binding transcriptional MerR regulator
MYIPDDKRYFRIGEVSRIVGVKPYVLRYWESEFPTVRPKRADSRQRVYKREDIETLGAIKKLLYEEKLTIAGAKNRLKAMKKGDAIAIPQGDILAEIKEELHQILKILD